MGCPSSSLLLGFSPDEAPFLFLPQRPPRNRRPLAIAGSLSHKTCPLDQPDAMTRSPWDRVDLSGIGLGTRLEKNDRLPGGPPVVRQSSRPGLSSRTVLSAPAWGTACLNRWWGRAMHGERGLALVCYWSTLRASREGTNAFKSTGARRSALPVSCRTRSEPQPVQRGLASTESGCPC